MEWIAVCCALLRWYEIQSVFWRIVQSFFVDRHRLRARTRKWHIPKRTKPLIPDDHGRTGWWNSGMPLTASSPTAFGSGLRNRRGPLFRLGDVPLLRLSTGGYLLQYPIPIGSMYGIFTYIWVIYGVNVGKYTIHGSYGIQYISRIAYQKHVLRNGQNWDDYSCETVFSHQGSTFFPCFSRVGTESDRVHGSCVTKCNKPKTKDFCQMISWRRTMGRECRTVWFSKEIV